MPTSTGAGSRRRRVAMSLLELMVSLVLAMILVGMAFTAFTRTSETVKRVTARVELHDSAANIRGFLNEDLANLVPSLALFARSRPQVAVSASERSDTVELVFMRAPNSLVDESTSDGYEQHKQDRQWVRWHFVRTERQVGGTWTVTSSTLYRATNTPTRRWTTLATWPTPGPLNDPWAPNADWTNYGGRRFINIPRPLRSAAQGIESLDFNRYGIPANRIDPASTMPDIGDYTDLQQNARIMSTRVRDLAIALVDAKGGTATVTSAAAADVRIDGVYPDGLGPAGNPYLAQVAGRPKVVRVAFSMTDRASGVDQAFSFSVATPGLQPNIGE